MNAMNCNMSLCRVLYLQGAIHLEYTWRGGSLDFCVHIEFASIGKDNAYLLFLLLHLSISQNKPYLDYNRTPDESLFED